MAITFRDSFACDRGRIVGVCSRPFSLDYLRDNGTLRNWATEQEPGCRLVRWDDDGDYSVVDASGSPLGWGETEEDAVSHARHLLTNRRRQAEGITPARVC